MSAPSSDWGSGDLSHLSIHDGGMLIDPVGVQTVTVVMAPTIVTVMIIVALSTILAELGLIAIYWIAARARRLRSQI